MYDDPDHEPFQEQSRADFLAEAQELQADDDEMRAKYISAPPSLWVAMDPSEACPQCHGRGEVCESAYIAECDHCHGVGAKAVVGPAQ